ncbi:MAG: polyisoprenoid-binding protein YceI [Granulosicoccus sp.]|jgi:polyisoprenoid-binding protein YceI
MKKTISSIFVAVLMVTSTAFGTNPVKDATYVVDQNASTVVWTGSKITGGSHTGTVAIKSGEFSLSGGLIKTGSFVLDMTTIANTDLSGGMKGKLEGHLKSEDFFSVEKHQTAELKITKGELHGDHMHASGNLTIKGITQPVKLEVTLSSKDGVFNASADVTVDRTKFDVKYGSDSFFDNLGDKAINNDISFKVNLTGKVN